MKKKLHDAQRYSVDVGSWAAYTHWIGVCQPINTAFSEVGETVKNQLRSRFINEILLGVF